MSRRHANRTIQAADVAGVLGPTGPTSERQARELTPLLDDEPALVETWRELKDR